MLNHIVINNGYAEDIDYGDRKYDQQLKDAAAFAVRHDLGVYALCGGFEVPAGPAPAAPPVDPRAPQAPAGDPMASQPDPVVPPAPAGACDASYPDVCIPPIAAQGDLDCGDVAFRRFTVVPPDPHGFDGDLDGVGCER